MTVPAPPTSKERYDTGPGTVRLAPPLILGDDEAEAFRAAWSGILDATETGAS